MYGQSIYFSISKLTQIEKIALSISWRQISSYIFCIFRFHSRSFDWRGAEVNVNKTEVNR